MKFKKRFFVIVGTTTVALLMACNNEEPKGDVVGKITDAIPVVAKEELSFLAVGDVMAHSTQINAAYDSSTDTYNFDENFAYVKEYIEEVDIAMCNVETVFDEGRYTGYPTFNAPDSLAEALGKAGFDVAFTANNHIIDQGSSGFFRTIDVLENYGMVVSGTRRTEEEDRFVMLEENGVKIGIVAYTYETPSQSGNGAINGIPIPSAVGERLSSFNPSNMNSEMTKITEDVKSAKEAGADILVCYFHWGEEYHTTPREYQRDIVAEMQTWGVDVIFASHPHVLQPAEVTYDESGENPMVTFYSMGNFISNQRNETLGNRLTEDGIMARVSFEITKVNGEVAEIGIASADAIPTWVNRYKSGDTIYEIIPLVGDFSDNQSLVVSGNLRKAEQSLVDSIEILGESHLVEEAGIVSVFNYVE